VQHRSIVSSQLFVCRTERTRRSRLLIDALCRSDARLGFPTPLGDLDSHRPTNGPAFSISFASRPSMTAPQLHRSTSGNGGGGRR